AQRHHEECRVELPRPRDHAERGDAHRHRRAARGHHRARSPGVIHVAGDHRHERSGYVVDGHRRRDDRGRPAVQPLERRDVNRDTVEAETEAEQRHDKRRAHDVPAIEISGDHATTVPTGGAEVWPLSDVIVPSAPGGPARVLRSSTVGRVQVLDSRTCNRARLARDRRFDGRFFTGVLTTRIYCRPTCPVKPAKSRNVVFFPTAAAAERAGFRPCLRCRPETAPGTPAWHGAAASVSRALRLIERGFLDDGKTVEDLADALGMTTRHLRRLFARHAGAAPLAVATTRRVQRAKRLVDETTMPMSAVAFAAGFASIRRFNAAFRAVYRRAPTAVGRAGT